MESMRGSTTSIGTFQSNAPCRQALMALQDDPEAMQRINTQTRRVEDAALTEGAALPEPLFEGCDVYAHKASPFSFAALRVLVTGCLLKELPTPKVSPSLHWYDARSRVIMLRVAHWLRVPRASFHALELEVMGDVTPTEALEVSQASLHSYHSKRMKWLKVGAAAVGGGVLTAVTAGLAAPAIVAGVGTLVGLTGSAGMLIITTFWYLQILVTCLRVALLNACYPHSVDRVLVLIDCFHRP